MWKLVFFIFIGYAATGFKPCHAQKPEIRLIDTNEKKLAPGSTYNLVVQLRNPSPYKLEISLKMKAPPGWTQLVEYEPIKVDSTENQLKVLPFHVSESARVGSYEIIIEAFNQQDGSKIGEVKVPVYIEAKYDLVVQALRSSKYVSAGDTITAKFLIHNLSNTEAAINLTTVNNGIIESKIIHLMADSTMLFQIPATAYTNQAHYARQNVSLSSYIVDHPETKSTNTFSFDVIPSSKISFDAYNRLPIRISSLMVTDNPRGYQVYAMMFDIQGHGHISKAKKRTIEFHFRGPQRDGNPLLGLSDKYYVKYSSPKSQLILGDSNYRLSDLTEASRNGLGIGYEYQGTRFQAGGYINYPRYYPKIRMISSAYLSSNRSKKTQIKGGYLHKFYADKSTASLFMIAGKSKPYKGIDLEFELAGGMKNGHLYKAYKSVIYTKVRTTRAHFIYTQADKDFPGFYNNSRFLSTGVSSRIKSNFSISFNYDLNHSNMVLDTLFVNAPFSQNLNVITNYRIRGNNRISIALFRRNREDRTEPQLFNYTEYSGRLSSQNRFEKLGIHGYVEMGKVQNYLPMAEGELTNSVQANLSMSYKLMPQFIIDAFINYQMGEKYQSTNINSFYYGATVNAKLSKNLKLLIAYQNNYQVEEYYRDRSLMNVNGHYTINQKHDLGVGINYHLVRNSLNRKEFSAFVRYTYSFRLKTTKVDNIGSLKGKILNHGVEKIDGLIINLAGNYTLTDKDGNFEFTTLTKGEYYLMLNDANTGLNTILEEPGPFKIQILPGQVTEIELAMTKSVNISGQIAVEQDSMASDKGYIFSDGLIKRLLLEAKKGEEVLRIFTDKEGRFAFNDLRPGKWSIKIYSAGLPSGYTIKREVFTLDLAPGQKYLLDVPIKRKAYKIKFQKSVE